MPGGDRDRIVALAPLFTYPVLVKRLGMLFGMAACLAAIHTGAATASYVPGEVLVRFEGQPTAQTVELPHGVDVGSAAAALRANRHVASATANYIARASGEEFIPNDPGLSGQRTGWTKQQWNFLTEAGVRAPEAWANAIRAGNPGAGRVKIAVLDTGVAYRSKGRFRRSPDFSSRSFLRGYDFVDDDREPIDENGHGTHVASTIAERADNGVGLTGLAYRARIMPLRVLDSVGSGDARGISRAIRLAANRRVDIINLSLEFDRSVRAAQIPDVLAAIRYARRRGAILISAAGNEGRSSAAYPGRASGVIAVGATTEELCRSEFSNYGDGLDLVAPGGGGADVFASGGACNGEGGGRDIYQLTFGANPSRFGYPGGYEGTSMAAAHVSGTAALIIASRALGENPTPDQIQRRLQGTARDLGPAGFDRNFGWGLVDAAAATAPPTG